MVRPLSILLVVSATGLSWMSVGSAAPKPADPATEKRDKAVKEFVAKVYDALGKHDFDAFVELCDVPFLIQPGVEKHGDVSLPKDKASIKKRFEQGRDLNYTRKFDGSKHEVRSIQTCKEAKPRFLKEDAKDADHVITDNDLVVHVVANDDQGKFHHRLLIKVVGGKPRLVGIQAETQDD
jgi:hypothetical protein